MESSASTRAFALPGPNTLRFRLHQGKPSAHLQEPEMSSIPRTHDRGSCVGAAKSPLTSSVAGLWRARSDPSYRDVTNSGAPDNQTQRRLRHSTHSIALTWIALTKEIIIGTQTQRCRRRLYHALPPGATGKRPNQSGERDPIGTCRDTSFWSQRCSPAPNGPHSSSTKVASFEMHNMAFVSYPSFQSFFASYSHVLAKHDAGDAYTRKGARETPTPVHLLPSVFADDAPFDASVEA